jgi:hypothetical protein
MSSSPFTESACPIYGKDNSTLLSAGYIELNGNLAPAHDAAKAHLGSLWRMPTKDEIDDLISNCTNAWTIKNGVYGRLVTGKGAYADKSIFLPAAGCGHGSNLDYPSSCGLYWSSTWYSRYSNSAWYLDFVSRDFSLYGSLGSYHGRSVRPVREFAK